MVEFGERQNFDRIDEVVEEAKEEADIFVYGWINNADSDENRQSRTGFITDEGVDMEELSKAVGADVIDFSPTNAMVLRRLMDITVDRMEDVIMHSEAVQAQIAEEHGIDLNECDDVETELLQAINSQMAQIDDFLGARGRGRDDDDDEGVGIDID